MRTVRRVGPCGEQLEVRLFLSRGAILSPVVEDVTDDLAAQNDQVEILRGGRAGRVQLQNAARNQLADRAAETPLDDQRADSADNGSVVSVQPSNPVVTGPLPTNDQPSRDNTDPVATRDDVVLTPTRDLVTTSNDLAGSDAVADVSNNGSGGATDGVQLPVDDSSNDGGTGLVLTRTTEVVTRVATDPAVQPTRDSGGSTTVDRNDSSVGGDVADNSVDSGSNSGGTDPVVVSRDDTTTDPVISANDNGSDPVVTTDPVRPAGDVSLSNGSNDTTGDSNNSGGNTTGTVVDLRDRNATDNGSGTTVDGDAGNSDSNTGGDATVTDQTGATGNVDQPVVVDRPISIAVDPDPVQVRPLDRNVNDVGNGGTDDSSDDSATDGNIIKVRPLPPDPVRPDPIPADDTPADNGSPDANTVRPVEPTISTDPPASNVDETPAPPVDVSDDNATPADRPADPPVVEIRPSDVNQIAPAGDDSSTADPDRDPNNTDVKPDPPLEPQPVPTPADNPVAEADAEQRPSPADETNDQRPLDVNDLLEITIVNDDDESVKQDDEKRVELFPEEKLVDPPVQERPVEPPVEEQPVAERPAEQPPEQVEQPAEEVVSAVVPVRNDEVSAATDDPPREESNLVESTENDGVAAEAAEVAVVEVAGADSDSAVEDASETPAVEDEASPTVEQTAVATRAASDRKQSAIVEAAGETPMLPVEMAADQTQHDHDGRLSAHNSPGFLIAEATANGGPAATGLLMSSDAEFSETGKESGFASDVPVVVYDAATVGLLMLTFSHINRRGMSSTDAIASPFNPADPSGGGFLPPLFRRRRRRRSMDDSDNGAGDWNPAGLDENPIETVDENAALPDVKTAKTRGAIDSLFAQNAVMSLLDSDGHGSESSDQDDGSADANLVAAGAFAVVGTGVVLSRSKRSRKSKTGQRQRPSTPRYSGPTVTNE